MSGVIGPPGEENNAWLKEMLVNALQAHKKGDEAFLKVLIRTGKEETLRLLKGSYASFRKSHRRRGIERHRDNPYVHPVRHLFLTGFDILDKNFYSAADITGKYFRNIHFKGKRTANWIVLARALGLTDELLTSDNMDAKDTLLLEAIQNGRARAEDLFERIAVIAQQMTGTTVRNTPDRQVAKTPPARPQAKPSEQ